MNKPYLPTSANLTHIALKDLLILFYFVSQLHQEVRRFREGDSLSLSEARHQLFIL